MRTSVGTLPPLQKARKGVQWLQKVGREMCFRKWRGMRSESSPRINRVVKNKTKPFSRFESQHQNATGDWVVPDVPGHFLKKHSRVIY
jgi:hypothetical protein